MTPEREVEIRADLKRGRLMFPAGDVHDLLAEIDSLQEKYARLEGGRMTPERETEIRALPLKSSVVVDLLAEIDRLREAVKHVTTVFHDERKGDLRLAMDSLSVALEGK